MPKQRACFLHKDYAGRGGMFPLQQNYFLAKTPAGHYSKVELTPKGSHQAALPHPKFLWHQVPCMCVYKSWFPGSLRYRPAVSSKTLLEMIHPLYVPSLTNKMFLGSKDFTFKNSKSYYDLEHGVFQTEAIWRISTWPAEQRKKNWVLPRLVGSYCIQ